MTGCSLRRLQELAGTDELLLPHRATTGTLAAPARCHSWSGDRIVEHPAGAVADLHIRLVLGGRSHCQPPYGASTSLTTTASPSACWTSAEDALVSQRDQQAKRDQLYATSRADLQERFRVGETATLQTRRRLGDENAATPKITAANAPGDPSDESVFVDDLEIAGSPRTEKV
jgi:hypothetical protein